MAIKLNIVLVQPEIPHNTGAIGRLCVGLDCRLHLVCPLGFSLAGKHVRRAGLDYWRHLNLSVHDSWEAFLAAEQPAHVWLATTQAQRSLFGCHIEPDAYLVFGSETRGLSAAIHAAHPHRRFAIPMPGEHARSLNLANAVAVVMYEAYRQLH